MPQHSFILTSHSIHTETRFAEDVQYSAQDLHHLHDDARGPLPEGRAVPQLSARC